MTNKQTHSPTLLVTPSLLNSWLYIYQCAENVRESEKDEICIEDKQSIAMMNARTSFIATLNRIKTPTTEAQQRGIDYEDECYKGNTDCSPIIEGGQFQIVGKKTKTIGGIDFLLYGRLDVLKGGIIYDIKRVSQYSPQKYLHSAQHPFYLELFKSAYKFTYLVYDGIKLHQESYFRDEVKPIESIIQEFIDWLKEENLYDTYELKWATKF